MARLAPALDKLRDEIDVLYPRRDKTSDGWLGNAEHSSRVSDHNPDESGMVHAIDVDEDLTGNSGAYPRFRSGQGIREIVDFILDRCRSGAEKRLWYIIYEGRIYSRTYGWVSRAYSGANPHDHHAHFSLRYSDAIEADRSSWLGGLGDRPAAEKPQVDDDVELADVVDVSALNAARGEQDEPSEDVAKVQYVLAAWYPQLDVKVDGWWGEKTQAAYDYARRQMGYTGDDARGAVGAESLGKLGIKTRA